VLIRTEAIEGGNNIIHHKFRNFASMKRFVIVILLILVTARVGKTQTKWQLVATSSNNTKTYVSRIQPMKNGHKRVWVKVVYSQPQNVILAMKRRLAYIGGDYDTLMALINEDPDAARLASGTDSVLVAQTVGEKQVLDEIDCDSVRYLHLQGTYYYLDGHAGEIQPFSMISTWTYANPDTPGDKIIQYVCSH